MSMQLAAEPAIEPGYHQFSIPRYPQGSRPRLYCWCGESVEMTATGDTVRFSPALKRFTSDHAACPPDEAWLMGRSN